MYIPNKRENDSFSKWAMISKNVTNIQELISRFVISERYN